MKKREKGLAVKSKASTIFSTVVSLFLNRRWIWFFFLFNSSINSYKPKKKKAYDSTSIKYWFSKFLCIQDHCWVEIDGKLQAKPRPLLWPTPKWRPFQIVINSQNTKKKGYRTKVPDLWTFLQRIYLGHYNT